MTIPMTPARILERIVAFIRRALSSNSIASRAPVEQFRWLRWEDSQDPEPKSLRMILSSFGDVFVVLNRSQYARKTVLRFLTSPGIDDLFSELLNFVHRIHIQIKRC